MRRKNPAHSGEVVEANLKELGLSDAEAAKAIGFTRQQLYNGINGRSAATPEMALSFEMRSAAAPACGFGCRLPAISRKCASPKKRSEYAASRGRHDVESR